MQEFVGTAATQVEMDTKEEDVDSNGTQASSSTGQGDEKRTMDASTSLSSNAAQMVKRVKREN